MEELKNGIWKELKKENIDLKEALKQKQIIIDNLKSLVKFMETGTREQKKE